MILVHISTQLKLDELALIYHYEKVVVGYPAAIAINIAHQLLPYTL